MKSSGTISQAYAIEIRGLSKSFGHRRALRDIDLQVQAGETLAVFGPNGAGKTTLIKVLAAIMNPSAGSVFIDGLSLKNSAEAVRRRIGVVTHQTYLYRDLTTYENLEFYSRMYDVEQARERIDEVLALVGMDRRLYDRVGTLSRGMQQRLSLARALLHNPFIMLLDEPETGLDQDSISIIKQSLQTTNNGKRTVILTTHNLERGLEIGDSLLILDKGRIVFREDARALNLTDLKKVYQQHTGVGA